MAYELNSLCEKTDLKGSVKSVYSKMCDHSSKKANGLYQCYPSIKTIAQEIGFSKRTVQRAVIYLRDNKYIFVEKRTWRPGVYPSNVYTIHIEKLILEAGGGLNQKRKGNVTLLKKTRLSPRS